MSDRPGTTTAGLPTPTPVTQSLTTRAVLLGTMAVWGLNLPVVKWLTGQIDPLLVSALRMVVASLALLLVLRWHSGRWPRPSAAQWRALAVCALLMLYLNQLCFTEGLHRTAAANAALIIALNPLLSSLLAALLLGERLHGARLLGVALGFGGVAAVVLHRPGMALGWPTVGDALVLGSVLTWVGGSVLVQRLARQMDALLISTLVTSLGTLMLLTQLGLGRWLAPEGLAPLPWQALLAGWNAPLLVASGLLATAAGAVVWNRSVLSLGVARTALYAYWVPIFGVCFAVALLGEPLSGWHAVGLAGVLGGTWLGTRRH